MSSSRAGVYQLQPLGYRAFIPAPMPPHPPVVIDDEMQGLLSKADRALGRLDGSIQTLPDHNLFVFMYVRKEAVLSSQIEGTQSSLNDLLEAEAEIFNKNRPADVKEVINYVKAMNHGLSRLNELPASIRLIKEIHEKLLTGVRGQKHRPGELRDSQNWIGPAGCTLNEATFVPPPKNAIMQALGDLEIFMHTDNSMPALIKTGLIHSQFETIHPFLDGNGRVGRLLITLLLCEKEILQTPVLYLSYYFKKNREEYYRLLQDVRENGAWEEWLKYFLLGISEVASEATETARRIVSLREEHRRLITNNFGRVAGNGLIILEQLFKSPIITVNKVVDLIGHSYTAANSLITKFIENGLLIEITGHSRNRRFKYSKYIDLFTG